MENNGWPSREAYLEAKRAFLFRPKIRLTDEIWLRILRFWTNRNPENLIFIAFNSKQREQFWLVKWVVKKLEQHDLDKETLIFISTYCAPPANNWAFKKLSGKKVKISELKWISEYTVYADIAALASVAISDYMDITKIAAGVGIINIKRI